jgi:hypothetical protein
MMVYTCGSNVMVWLNNELIVDCDTTHPLHPERLDQGAFLNNFAFQLHKRQEVQVRFKDIEIVVPKYVNEDDEEIDMFIGCDFLH